jgi:hypothetical protein
MTNKTQPPAIEASELDKLIALAATLNTEAPNGYAAALAAAQMAAAEKQGRELRAARAARDFDAEAERPFFEAKYSDNGASPKAIERDQSGNYKLMQAHLAWSWWQITAQSIAERE